MTQADLAEIIGVTDKAVSRWERGIGFPDINTLEPLAVDASWVIWGLYWMLAMVVGAASR